MRRTLPLPYLAGLSGVVLLIGLAQLVAVFQALSAAESPDPTRSVAVSFGVLATTVTVLLVGGTAVLRPLARRLARETEALSSTSGRLQTVLDNALVGVLLVDGRGRVREGNRRTAQLLGLSGPLRLVDRDLEDLAASSEAATALSVALDQARTFGAAEPREVSIRRADGTCFVAECWVSRADANVPSRSAPSRRATDPAVPDHGSAPVVVLLQDLTSRKEAEEQLAYLALHDPVTGLPNRTLLLTRVANALADGGARRTALVFVDLDDFKTVNDSLGHAAGDRLLVEVAHRLALAVPPGATAARIGGDEFAVLIENLPDGASVDPIVERLLAALEPTAVLDGVPVSLRASMGVARANPEGNAGDLLRDADAAMYTAKGGGKGGWALFDPTMHERAVARLSLVSDLTAALAAGQFHLVYQPIVDISTHRPVSMEALLRWEHPDRGPVSPADFVPVLEETGAIREVGRWVLHEACRQLARWQGCVPGIEDLRMSVNVSPVQLQDPQFDEEVLRALAAANVRPECLQIEVTESVLLRQDAPVLDVLARLRERGVCVALDDFGTGYSALAYLHLLPADVVKVDRSFVRELGGSSRREAVTAGVIDLAHRLGLKTVAEGVETTLQLQRLREFGCQTVQGFIISRPLEPERVRDLLSDLGASERVSAGAAVRRVHAVPDIRAS